MASKFQKRHYLIVADVLADAARMERTKPYTSGAHMRRLIARDLADVFAGDNGLFDRGRFARRAGTEASN